MKLNSSIFKILALASLPFIAKGAVLYVGLSGYVLQSLYKVLQLLIPTIWRYTQGSKRGIAIFWPVDIVFPPLRTIIIATGIGLLLPCIAISGIYILQPYLHIDPSVIRASFDERFTVDAIGAISVALFLATANAALEELHFRHWMNGELLKYMKPLYGYLISSTLFAAMHMLIFTGLDTIPSLLINLAIFGIFIIGMLWSFLSRLPGGIHAAWWSHCLNNIILMSWGLYWLRYI